MTDNVFVIYLKAKHLAKHHQQESCFFSFTYVRYNMQLYGKKEYQNMPTVLETVTENYIPIEIPLQNVSTWKKAFPIFRSQFHGH